MEMMRHDDEDDDDIQRYLNCFVAQIEYLLSIKEQFDFRYFAGSWTGKYRCVQVFFEGVVSIDRMDMCKWHTNA